MLTFNPRVYWETGSQLVMFTDFSGINTPLKAFFPPKLPAWGHWNRTEKRGAPLILASFQVLASHYVILSFLSLSLKKKGYSFPFSSIFLSASPGWWYRCTLLETLSASLPSFPPKGISSLEWIQSLTLCLQSVFLKLVWTNTQQMGLVSVEMNRFSLCWVLDTADTHSGCSPIGPSFNGHWKPWLISSSLLSCPTTVTCCCCKP